MFKVSNTHSFAIATLAKKKAPTQTDQLQKIQPLDQNVLKLPSMLFTAKKLVTTCNFT